MVDLDGRPLAGMMPIATTRANAFDEPAFRGDLTQEDGAGTMAFPPDQHVFVRAWDPALRIFANNYLEVTAEPGLETDVMTITMVPGAALDATLLDANGQPIANTNVGLMMFHPTEGPWWPAEADTNAQGRVHFPSVPAGKYTLKLKAANGHQAEMRDVVLPPAGKADLGQVTLRPE